MGRPCASRSSAVLDSARLIGLFVVLLTFGAGGANAQTSMPLPCPLEPGPTRAVASVLDGDSVRLDDGAELALLGVLVPKERDGGGSAQSMQWQPAVDARQALTALVGGRGVALAFAGPRSDRYGRVLAHLFVDVGGEQVWVQGRLVEQGHARAQPLPKSPDPCHAALVARERDARRRGLGLWAHAAYQVRPGDRPGELARFRDTFQLVRGRIERTRATKGLIIIEFTSNERSADNGGQRLRSGAFQAIVRRRSIDALKLPEWQTLAGRNVLVRGWISRRRWYGPEIEVVAAGQLELED